MQVYLKEQVPQKFIKISGHIFNGIKGSYTLSAEVSYSGFTYLEAVSNEFYIEDHDLETISGL
jgi:hypothetical protein